MKKLTLLLILLIGSFSYGQVILYQNAPDRQKITEFEKRNDSLVISLENSGTNKVYLGDLRTDISGKANINSPTFTGNVVVPTATISDAAVNLGQMMDSLATVGTGLIQEIASTKTLTKEDAWIVYRNRSVGDSVTYTIPNQVNGGFTEDIGYTFYTKTTGKIFVKGETGSGVEPVEISGAGRYETIIRVGENSWDWSKGVLPWTPAWDPFTDPHFVAGFWAEDLGADESLVETWADRTGNGNNAAQSTSANRPKVNIEADGKKAVDFDGTNDGLMITDVPALDFSPGNPITIVIVTGEKDFGTDQFLLFKGDTSSSVTGVEYGFYSSNPSIMRGNIYGSNTGAYAKTSMGVDVWVVTSDGTTATIYLNGSNMGTSSVGTANIASNIWIGNRLGTAKFFNGSIRAIGIANIELNSGQLATINNFEW